MVGQPPYPSPRFNIFSEVNGYFFQEVKKCGDSRLAMNLPPKPSPIPTTVNDSILGTLGATVAPFNDCDIIKGMTDQSNPSPVTHSTPIAGSSVDESSTVE